MNYLLTGEETARLRFRKVQPGDFDTCLEFFNDPRTRQYWKSPITEPRQLAREWLDKQLWRYDHQQGGANLLLTKQTNQVVGWCGLVWQQVDDVDELEIAYSLLPMFWGQGYATEAAQLAKEVAFARKLSPSLISIIHVNNTPSQRVAERNGMKISATTVYRDNPVDIWRVSSGSNQEG